jgi:hypothetical protein
MYYVFYVLMGHEFAFCDDGVILHPTKHDLSDPQLVAALKHAQTIYPAVDASANLAQLVNRIWPRFYENSDDEYLQKLVAMGAVLLSQSEVPYSDDMKDIVDHARGELERRRIRDEAKAAKLARKNRLDPGYVYLVQSPTGTYKIGRSLNVKDRLKTFHLKLPFEVELVHIIECERMRQAEGCLHQRFETKRINESEFFALTDEDVAWIKSIERM